MSKQFRFYLLSSDIERLIAELRSRCEIKCIEDVSTNPYPNELISPIRLIEPASGAPAISSVYCYLTESVGTQIQMWYMSTRELWALSESSEVIEFSGCDFDGKTLRIGRFYFQTDMLIGDAIWPKRKEFLDWGNNVFRVVKKSLIRSKELDAYLGQDAEKWIHEGGSVKQF